MSSSHASASSRTLEIKVSFHNHVLNGGSIDLASVARCLHSYFDKKVPLNVQHTRTFIFLQLHTYETAPMHSREDTSDSTIYMEDNTNTAEYTLHVRAFDDEQTSTAAETNLPDKMSEKCSTIAAKSPQDNFKGSWHQRAMANPYVFSILPLLAGCGVAFQAGEWTRKNIYLFAFFSHCAGICRY